MREACPQPFLAFLTIVYFFEASYLDMQIILKINESASGLSISNLALKLTNSSVTDFELTSSKGQRRGVMVNLFVPCLWVNVEESWCQNYDFFLNVNVCRFESKDCMLIKFFLNKYS